MEESNSSWWSKLWSSSKPEQKDTSETNERTALLPDSPPFSYPSSINSEREERAYLHQEKQTTALKELGVIVKTSIPVIIAYTLQNSLQTTSVLVVGRISPAHLATAAFSYMFAMSTAWLIALGGTTALDTLCSSSFTGSKNPFELGILLQRAFVVLGGMYLVVVIIWLNSEKLFHILGQEEALSRDSALFLKWLIPGGLGYIYL